MKNKNILLIGLGSHARRIYLPRIIAFKQLFPIDLVACIELSSAKNTVDAYLEKNKYDVKMYYFQPFKSSDEFPRDVENSLNQILENHNIEAVIISTDPTSHKVYAKWALKHGLHILMDKPITTRSNVINDISQAKGIYADYVDLLAQYLELQKTKHTIFSINTQRRYEVGYQKVNSLIREATEKFNIPVTSIQAMHADGVWIFPDEIREQTYHPYNTGYGKNSHSGYHIFDIVWQFYLAGLVESKKADRGEALTSSLLPNGLLSQFNYDDYINLFNEKFLHKQKYPLKDLNKYFKNYGEIDTFSIVRLLKNNELICNISINLLHNSFSRRAWVVPNQDLYKGNGRIKHQSFQIQQGPFQCIQILNYQSNDKQESSNIEDYKLGGNNHFEINVFRNSELFGKEEEPLRSYTLLDLENEKKRDERKLYHETAKDEVIYEFINFVIGKNRNKNTLLSNITSHSVGVKILSAVYQSEVNSRLYNNPLSTFMIDNKFDYVR